MYNDVQVEIVEQPESKSKRFRYLCEGRTAGSILGVNATDDVKTYPSIRVLNYDGSAVVVVSCVNESASLCRENNTLKYKVHPNCLIGKKCSRGVCTYNFDTKSADPRVVAFPNIGIQCAKRTDIVKNLDERAELRIDPYRAGFDHRNKPKFINLHKIRLCFQVLLQPDPLTNPKKLIPLKPVVSEVISDKQRTNVQLLIHDVSDSTSPPCGGKKIMIFCDKVDKKDIQVRFYEEDANESVVWEDWAVFKVHKQVAISFNTPKYKVQNIEGSVKVFFRLETKSDGTVSNPIPFEYVPDERNIEFVTNTKKRKFEHNRTISYCSQIPEAGNRQNSKMTMNIDPNEVGAENVAPENSNFIPSNFFASNNNNLLQPLPLPPYTDFQVRQNQREQPFQQLQLDRKQFQPQQSDYQWPSSQLPQPLQMQNIQPQPVHQVQQQFGNIQREQPLYNQQQYQAQSQLNHTEASYGSYLPTHTHNHFGYHSEVGNVYGAAANLNSNTVGNNCGRQTQPIPVYNSSSLIDTPCPIQMSFDAPPIAPSSSHQHSCQQMGTVYGKEKVIIQQFYNNNLTFNQQQQQQQQNLADIQNMAAECLNSELNLL